MKALMHKLHDKSVVVIVTIILYFGTLAGTVNYIMRYLSK